jgi:uncharacterized membrane protein SpoIIM required for sporulation
VNPQIGYAFLSGSEVRGPGSDPELLREALQHGRDTGTGYRALFSSWLFAHNTRVGFLAFAAGIFFCVPTLILIIYNGLTLGAMSAVYHAAGLPVDWWAWVLPHGITELLAISIVSAAGLLLGYSLIDPQGRPRLQALAGRGRQAVVLVVGSIPMLLLAALVEGFLRQSGLSTAARLAFAAGSLVCWLYFFRTGTVREHRETSSALPVGVRADSVPVSPGTSRSAAR